MQRSIQNRLATAAYWLLPSLICLWLHRDGLHAWFQADDFAFLGANTEYYNAKTFLRALFQPTPQGGFRPWSEHLFFFAFWHWFGWNAMPYRIFVMANQCLNLMLVSYLVRKLSGSKVAGLLAPILWIANSALVPAMAWTCAYEEVLCATFLLGALSIFVYAGERKRIYFLQLAVFVLGFGALEINMVYPVLAAAYAYFFNRRLLPRTVPLFAISAIFFTLHIALSPIQTGGPYQPHYDSALISTFFKYWQLVFVPPYGFITVQPILAGTLLIAATLGLALFLFRESRQHRFAAAFFACWFLGTLAPLLPFRDHLTHYYLTIPLIGLAAVGALAFVRWRAASAAVLALYLWVQVPTLAEGERWYLERSRAARGLIMGVKQIHEWEPTKSILLADLPADLYGYTVADAPFRLIPNTLVYLAPESLQQIAGLAPNLAPVSMYALPPGPTRQGLLANQFAVYSAAGLPLREITAEYTAQALARPEPEVPSRIDPGSPWMAYLLGPEWYPPEGPYRWMPKRATLRIRGPRDASQRLYVNGFAVAESLRMQPLEIMVSLNGKLTGRSVIGPHDASFVRDFALPAEFIGKPSVTLGVEVNRTFLAEGHGRELGLVFGVFEIR